MTEEAVMTTVNAESAIAGGCRPYQVNKDNGDVRIITPRGVVMNSLLKEKEWAAVDAAVIESALAPLRGVADLRAAGLTSGLGGIGTLVSQWYTGSELTGASINMTGQGKGERDLPDLKQAGVPIPVIFKEFVIDARTLAASRKMGDGLDTTTARMAGRVVAEAMETLLFSGANTNLNGANLYGYRTHPDRNTDTASNYGGGDWGTITNVVPTIAGAINAANLDNHYGPYVLYVSMTQFNQAAYAYFTDGTVQSALDRVRGMEGISDIRMVPAGWLPDGEALLIQMDNEVVDWAEALGVTTLEWASGDGMTSMFKVMTICAPRIKSRYDGKSGIVHITGC